MQVIKKFEHTVLVYFYEIEEEGQEEVFHKTEDILIVSSEEVLSEDELIEIARQIGGNDAAYFGVVKSWYETV